MRLLIRRSERLRWCASATPPRRHVRPARSRSRRRRRPMEGRTSCTPDTGRHARPEPRAAPDAPTVAQDRVRSILRAPRPPEAEHLALYTSRAARVDAADRGRARRAARGVGARSSGSTNSRPRSATAASTCAAAPGGATADAFVRVTPTCPSASTTSSRARRLRRGARTAQRDERDRHRGRARRAGRRGAARRVRPARRHDPARARGQVTGGGAADTATAHAIGQLMSVTVRRLSFPAALASARSRPSR